MRLLYIAPLLLLLLAPDAQISLAAAATSVATSPIQHVVVIFQENHSFDNYFGTFPGANGIQNDPPTVHPYHITGSITDLCHSTICAHIAYDNGKMDGFPQAEGSKQTFGYYNKKDIPYYWGLARNYTLFDNYFTSAMGPSLPNHLYLVAGQDAGVPDSVSQGPAQMNIGSIVNELSAAKDTWGYYSPYTMGNENALGLVSSVIDNATMVQNLKGSDQFIGDLQSGKMPAVSYITANDGQNEHPPYDIATGVAWVQSIISAIQASPYWGSTVIFLTWDDYGGWYDHVIPPQVDKHGLGFRVPLLMVSPFAKHGYIDHTVSDHTSLMKFIERVFGLAPVTQRDAMTSDLMEALSSSYVNNFTDDSFTMQGTPTYSNLAGTPALDAYAYNPSISFAFMNNQAHPQQAVFYAALRNTRNQTVQLIKMKSTLPEGKTTQIPFTFQNQPAGAYTVTVLSITTKGVALSQPFRLVLNSTITDTSQTVTSHSAPLG